MACEDAVKLAGVGAQAAGAIGSTYSSYRSSQATAQGYQYQADVARNNEQLLNWQADDALMRGGKEQNRIQLAGSQLEGKQRSILASRNVAINEGSAANILMDTRFMQKRDEATAGDNAAKDAWALRNQAINQGSNAAFLTTRADAQSPLLDAAGTALTGAGKVAQSWYSLKDKATSPATGSVWTDTGNY